MTFLLSPSSLDLIALRSLHPHLQRVSFLLTWSCHSNIEYMLCTWCPQWRHAHIFPKPASEDHLWLLSGNSKGLVAVLHPQASCGLSSHLECAPPLPCSSLIHPCNRPSSVSFHTWGTQEGYEFGAHLGYTAEDCRAFTKAPPNTLPLSLFLLTSLPCPGSHPSYERTGAERKEGFLMRSADASESFHKSLSLFHSWRQLHIASQRLGESAVWKSKTPTT